MLRHLDKGSLYSLTGEAHATTVLHWAAVVFYLLCVSDRRSACSPLGRDRSADCLPVRLWIAHFYGHYRDELCELATTALQGNPPLFASLIPLKATRQSDTDLPLPDAPILVPLFQRPPPLFRVDTCKSWA